MGLIKAFSGEMSNTLSSQWRDCYECGEFPTSVLIVKGQKSSDRHRISARINVDNSISSGSKIVVKNGQCAIIVCNGMITELCAEPGGYTFDTYASPSAFLGIVGISFLWSFKENVMGFRYDEHPGFSAYLYFINLSELYNNRFATEQPLSFRTFYYEYNRSFEDQISYEGLFSYKIADPISFYQYVSENFKERTSSTSINSEMKNDILKALVPAVERVSDMGLTWDQVGLHRKEIKFAILEEVRESWLIKWGMELTYLSLSESIILSEEHKKTINDKKSKIYSNPQFEMARMIEDVLRDMENDPSISKSHSMTDDSTPKTEKLKPNEWKCSCGKINDR